MIQLLLLHRLLTVFGIVVKSHDLEMCSREVFCISSLTSKSIYISSHSLLLVSVKKHDSQNMVQMNTENL